MINDESSAWECINKLHQMGPKQIVITSTNLSREGSMVGFFSDNINGIRGSINVPELTDTRLVTDENKKGFVEFTGTGDMFAACLCGHSGKVLNLEILRAVPSPQKSFGTIKFRRNNYCFSRKTIS